MAVSIRRMRKSDLDEVMALENIIFPSPWSSSTFESEISRKGGLYLVSVSEGRVIGYSGVIERGADLHLTTMAVHPQHRREGVATRLMFAHLVDAREKGVRRFTLEVRRSNRAAQDFYRNLGLKVAGVVKDYYFMEGEDAVIMWSPELKSGWSGRLGERLGYPVEEG